MTITIQATFDGQVFRPDETPTLLPNTHVEITIKPVEGKPPPQQAKSSFLAAARTLKVDEPHSWLDNLDGLCLDQEGMRHSIAKEVLDDLNFLVDNPNKSMMSTYHDAGSCWDLIETAVAEIRKLRKQIGNK